MFHGVNIVEKPRAAQCRRRSRLRKELLLVMTEDGAEEIPDRTEHAVGRGTRGW
jgi:hypothetical protein